ncbi:hypothetical protein [Streptococcus pneumoniae]|nr:hypothetical protein [Streptococcus pneumoniae]
MNTIERTRRLVKGCATQERTRRLVKGCATHCFEVVDRTDEVS